MTMQLKKWLPRYLLLFGLLGLTACGGGGGNGTPADPNQPNQPNDPNQPNPPGTTFAVANDAFTWLGNASITVPAANGVRANDTLATGIASFQNPSTKGGAVNVTADGGFTYEPPLLLGPLPFTDTFTYTATDGVTTADGTVTITINNVVRYVKNDFTGTSNGSMLAPFAALADAATAAAAASVPGDIIYVFTGNAATLHNGAINLQPNQKLIGQGVGLTFDVLPNLPLPINGVVVATPPVPPVLTRTAVGGIAGNVPVITLANNVEVAGFIIDGTGVLTNLMGMSGAPIGFNIHDNTIRNLPKAAIQLSGATGGTGMIVGNTIANLTGNQPDNAIDIITTAAGVNFTITGNALDAIFETGIRVQFGSGAAVVNNNTLTNVGTVAGGRGIDIEGAGTTTISGNTVVNTITPIARSGIQVNATGVLAASVTDNSVQNANPADGGFQAQPTTLASTLCLRMTGNTTANNFILDNRTTSLPASFRIEGPLLADFETANTATGGVFTYLPNVGAVSFVPVGTCGFAP